MRTIACEGNCPFLLLHFLVFVDNKMYICHTQLDLSLIHISEPTRH